jgi:hypothetical protein
MDGAILQNVPWFLILLAFVGGGWLGLRLGVRFHAMLANVPFIGVNASVAADAKREAELAAMREQIKQLTDAIAKLTK